MEKMLVNVDDKIRENITPRGDGNIYIIST